VTAVSVGTEVKSSTVVAVLRRFSPQKTDTHSSEAARTEKGDRPTRKPELPVVLKTSLLLFALTFVPATAPCAVMLPTGEQLSTRSTLNSRSSSDDGIRGELLWAVFASLLVCQAGADNEEEQRAHHGLFTAGPIALASLRPFARRLPRTNLVS